MFINVNQAAGTLQMGIQQVYYLLSMGEIEAVKFGRHWRLVPEAVDDYVKRHPERKNRESSGYFIYTGNSGCLFSTLSDSIPTDTHGEAAGMERRRGKLVHCPGRSDKILLQKLKPLKQLELFTA